MASPSCEPYVMPRRDEERFRTGDAECERLQLRRHVNYREIIRRYTSSTLTMGTHGVRRIIFGLLPATARNIMCGSP